MQAKLSSNTIVPIESSMLKKALEKASKLQEENELISSIASSTCLDYVINNIAVFINKRWALNILGLQLCDYENATLNFCKLINSNVPASNYPSLEDVSFPLDRNYCVSAKVAVDKNFQYCNFKDFDAKASDFDGKISHTLHLTHMLFIPIVKNGNSVGVIRLSTTEQNVTKLDPALINEVVLFLNKISGIISNCIYITNLEKFSDIQERNLNLIEDLSSTTDLSRITKLLNQEISSVGVFDAVMINVLDTDARCFTCESIHLPDRFSSMNNVLLGITFPFDADAFENSWTKTHKPIIVNKHEFSICSPFISERCSRWEMQSMAIMPIIASGIIVGTVALFKKTANFNSREISQLIKKISLFSGALKTAAHLSKVNKKEEEALRVEHGKTRFLKFIEHINHISKPDEIFKNISDEFINSFCFNVASIHMVEDDFLVTKNITVDESINESVKEGLRQIHQEISLKLKAGESVQVSTVLNNSTTHIPDVQMIKNLPMAEKDFHSVKMLDGVRTVIHVPIRVGNHPVGVLSLWSFTETVEISKDEISLIELICSFAGSTISNSYLFSMIGSQKDEIEQKVEELNKTQDLLKLARDAAESSTQAKTEFLANMSHEIRTPMNAIANFAELALKTNLNPKQSDYLTKIKKSSSSLLSIINDILDLSKIEANKLPVENIEFDITDILNDINDLFSERVAEKGLAFYINGASAINNCFIGDPLRVKQILTNIVNNSLKFTSEGVINITVSHEKLRDNTSQLKFSVSDTGIGIPSEKIDTLFESFSQADCSITRRYGGTGLGLTISKQLCNMMGGDIWAESDLGKGSVFNFTLKLANASALSLINQLVTDDIKNKSILIINEDESQQNYLDNLLSELNPKLTNINSCKNFNIFVKDHLDSVPDIDLIIIDENLYTHRCIDALACLCKQTSSKCIVLQSQDNHDSYIYYDAIATKPLRDSTMIDLMQNVINGTKPTASQNNTKCISFIEKKFYSSLCNNNVLLVDDNEINLQIAQELLELVGINVTSVDSGLKAINALNKNQYDLVITDVQMPHMDGYKLTSIIRQSFTDLPIIALTAHAMQGYKEQCIASGMNDYVSKPIDQATLYKCLTKWLKPKNQDILSINEAVITKASQKVSPDLFKELNLVSDIDIPLALVSVGNKRNLFVNVLRTFNSRYKDAASYIRKKLAENNIGAAKDLSHSLKGLSGTIGVTTLFEITKSLDVALKEHENKFRSDIFHIIDKLESELELVTADVSTLITSTILAKDEHQIELREGSNHIELFATCLVENNYKSLELMPYIRSHFIEEKHKKSLDIIETAIEKFDFSTARNIFNTSIMA